LKTLTTTLLLVVMGMAAAGFIGWCVEIWRGEMQPKLREWRRRRALWADVDAYSRRRRAR
jgi:hypothetical protein